MTTPYPIISFQTSSPDEDLLTGNASASELPENAYIEMDKVKTPSNQQYLSIISAKAAMGNTCSPSVESYRNVNDY